MSDENDRPTTTRRRFLRAGGKAVVATTAAAAILSEEAGIRERQPFLYVPFDREGYERTFTEVDHNRQNRLVSGPEEASRSLRVDIPRGDHYGTRLRYNFSNAGHPEPEELHSRYYLYVPSGFELGSGDMGKLPGPAGTYGEAGWGGRASDGTNGWSARMGFFDPRDSDSPLGLESYVYHADMRGNYGSNYEWDLDGNGLLRAERWYRIDNYVRMNAPGRADGVIRGWVDGDLALDMTNVRFRTVDDLKVQDFRFTVYYGGSYTSPADNSLYFSNLMLWRDHP